MSTNWFYRCMSHTPNIGSDYLFTYPAPLVTALHRQAEIVDIPSWVWDQVDFSSYNDAHCWPWLRQHATCTVGIFNEYGASLAEWEARNAEHAAFVADRKAKNLCHMRTGTATCGLTSGHEGRCDFTLVAA